MQWRGRRESGNVEDMRGSGGGRRGLALGGVGTIIVVIIGLLMGKNPLELLQVVSQNAGQPTEQTVQPNNPSMTLKIKYNPGNPQQSQIDINTE